MSSESITLYLSDYGRTWAFSKREFAPSLEQLGWKKVGRCYYKDCKRTNVGTVTKTIEIDSDGVQIDLFEELIDGTMRYMTLEKQELLALAEIVKEM